MAESKVDEFAFVLLAGLILIIIMMLSFTAPPQVKTNRTNETITGVNVSANDISRFINMGDFAVTYDLGQDTLVEKKNVVVSRGFSSEKHVNMVGIVTNDKLAITTSGFIDIIVDDSSEDGNLIVTLNDNEVFNKKVGPGRVAIPLKQDQIKDTNVVTIKCGSPGWKFWANTVYEISSAKMGINFQGINFKTFSFVMSTEEVSKFKFGRITFNAKSTSPMKNDLVIKINDNTIFRGVPPQTFIKDFDNKIYLAPAANNITFSVDKATSYELTDVTLVLVRKA